MIDNLKTLTRPIVHRLLGRDRFARRYDKLVSRMMKHFSGRVVSGPFAGMKLLNRYDLNHSAFLPKLVGSYEAELHPAVYSSILRRHSCVINIGAADGYYAVGYALATTCDVLAFEIDDTLREQCRKMAQLNGVENRFKLFAECTREELSRVMQPNALLVVDCEGCETDLLDYQIPEIKTAEILVEAHEHLNPGDTDLLLERFALHHDVYCFSTQPRDRRKYPFISFLSDHDATIVLNEYRHGLDFTWLYCVPRLDTLS